MRSNPHILEINVRVWFLKIQREVPGVLTLADVPDSYLAEIKEWGFDALWLMGVWKTGAVAREVARENAGINEAVGRVVGDYSREDIWASPFAILDYEADEMFGGNGALLKFKQRLNEMGVALILDFVGNHLTVDHPLTLSDPEIFVRPGFEPEDKETFFLTEGGEWLAHGKDPNTPAWTDTVQLNLFHPRARELVVEQILQVMDLCDGVRCDVTMVMLGKIFEGTWEGYVREARPEEELWTEVLRAARAKDPSFVFVAEVYWGLEWELQQLGFDYTYDKVIYDRLLLSTPSDVRGHLGAELDYQARSVRFIGNHDEELPVAVFGAERAKAAAVVTSTVPGARLFILNQLYGEKLRLPVQYVPRSGEINEEVFGFYRGLLEIINHPCFHEGKWEMLGVRGAEDVFAWVWTWSEERRIVVVNYSGEGARFVVEFVMAEGARVREEFRQEEVEVVRVEGGFEVEMGAWGVGVFATGA